MPLQNYAWPQYYTPPPSVPGGNWWGGQALPWGPGAGTDVPQWKDWYGKAAGGGPEAQGWMNVMLPWYQQAQQEQQFRAQLQYLQWQQQLQTGQAGEQLGYQRWATAGGWEQEAARQAEQLGFQRWQQTGQWGQTAALQEQQLAARETEAAYGAFGRRWRPNTRWT